MQITVTGRHLDVTDSMRNYVAEKFERLERHFDQVQQVDVILGVEKQRQMAEATIHVNGQHLHAESTMDDMYAAIDTLTDKLDRQITKHKEKLKDHHRSESMKRQPEAIETGETNDD